jgi:hypothetical protein
MRTAAAALAGTVVASCVDGTGREFREAALPAVQTGINAILDGLVDGVFASIEPDAAPDATTRTR